jgi:hypothetical protein
MNTKQWSNLHRLIKKYNLNWSEDFGEEITFDLYNEETEESLGVFLELEDILEFLILKEKTDEPV